MKEETKKEETTKAVEKPKAERKLAVSVSMLKKMAENPKLTEEFYKQIEQDTETIAPILFKIAEAMIKQLKINV